jgi:hypothetical protein
MHQKLDYTKCSFLESGLKIHNNWLKTDILDKLNEELDYYFSDISMNASIRAQFYDPTTLIFDHVNFLSSVNIYELMVDLVEEWKLYYPEFDSKEYILTRISFKDERGAPDPILWHTDQHAGTLRNIIYLKGGKKDSGLFRLMVGTHNIKHNIDFAMTKEEVEFYSNLIHDCEAPAGSALFFDAKAFHSNYPRVNQRRSIILTWLPKNQKLSESRIPLSSNNLSERVIKNIRYFANPDYKFFKIKDYDFNPPRVAPLGKAFKYFLESFNLNVIIQVKVKIRRFLDVIQGKPQKYDGPYLVKKH